VVIDVFRAFSVAAWCSRAGAGNVLVGEVRAFDLWTRYPGAAGGRGGRTAH
jgi:hypothetical protein